MDAATTIVFLGILCFPFKQLKIPKKKNRLLVICNVLDETTFKYS